MNILVWIIGLLITIAGSVMIADVIGYEPSQVQYWMTVAPLACLWGAVCGWFIGGFFV